MPTVGAGFRRSAGSPVNRHEVCAPEVTGKKIPTFFAVQLDLLCDHSVLSDHTG